ncbi:MAG: hypothetical protein DWQ02_13835 [Bacteroidetes bacterium]|nr:MAG: hypothetical protein DWQ02_13835 [Bacteroidota bacterium]
MISYKQEGNISFDQITLSIMEAQRVVTLSFAKISQSTAENNNTPRPLALLRCIVPSFRFRKTFNLK